MSVVEKSKNKIEDVEFTGAHLEAAFLSRANYHKARILKAFGAEKALPPIHRSDMATEYLQSEKRYRKASDMLYREGVVEIPPATGGITRGYLIALADNLAWRGIENVVTTEHLHEVEKIVHKLQARDAGRTATSGRIIPVTEEVAGIMDRAKSLKTIAMADNHFYRDFFSSALAADFKLDSPAVIKKFLEWTSLNGRHDDGVDSLVRGMSLEIAAERYVSDLLVRDERFRHDSDRAIVNFGHESEDRRGGDIVVLRGDSVLFIDIKSARRGVVYNDDELERGYRLRAENGVYKATVWPEIANPIAADSFRIADPAMRNSLQSLLLETL